MAQDTIKAHWFDEYYVDVWHAHNWLTDLNSNNPELSQDQLEDAFHVWHGLDMKLRTHLVEVSALDRGSHDAQLSETGAPTSAAIATEALQDVYAMQREMLYMIQPHIARLSLEQRQEFLEARALPSIDETFDFILPGDGDAVDLEVDLDKLFGPSDATAEDIDKLLSELDKDLGLDDLLEDDDTDFDALMAEVEAEIDAEIAALSKEETQRPDEGDLFANVVRRSVSGFTGALDELDKIVKDPSEKADIAALRDTVQKFGTDLSDKLDKEKLEAKFEKFFTKLRF